MRFRDAIKLRQYDEIKIKGSGEDEVETVSHKEVHGGDIYIYTIEGSDYHHTAIA